MKNTQKIEYLISLFFSTGRVIKEKTGQDEGLDPISMLQLEALRFIETEKPTMKQIAEYLHVKAPSATSLINGLVKNGYVKREENDTDRRIVQMSITNTGKLHLKEGYARVTESTKKILSKLKQEQIDDFIQIMEDIKNAYK